MGKKLSINKQKELISEKENGSSVKELSVKFDIAECTAYNIIKRGAKEYKVANKRYSVNDKYFKNIDNEEKAYWLGFLYADGYVRMKYERSGELRLKLCRKDKEHIELFKECLESTHPIKDFKSVVVVNDKEHKSDVSSVSIYNTEIVQDLYKHGCTNCKTFTIEFPELRADLVRHFIRGYFDGDGHVTITKGYNFGRAGLTSGSELFIDMLTKELNDINIGFKICERDNCYISNISNKKNMLKFYEYMYKDSNIFLNRKKKKFDELFTELF